RDIRHPFVLATQCHSKRATRKGRPKKTARRKPLKAAMAPDTGKTRLFRNPPGKAGAMTAPPAGPSDTMTATPFYC
ncbi:hypothetical protein, partial [Oxalobacter paraformigenes]|uniref:hypothetical protein n=1 Tax=Oxalobacter paraformigenes TaxID=556268 RepID=UPI001C9D5AF3